MEGGRTAAHKAMCKLWEDLSEDKKEKYAFIATRERSTTGGYVQVPFVHEGGWVERSPRQDRGYFDLQTRQEAPSSPPKRTVGAPHPLYPTGQVKGNPPPSPRTDYDADATPLAVTQKDFLVLRLLLYCNSFHYIKKG